MRLESFLPILFLLACPLMMIFMMRGMGHGGHAHGAGSSGETGQGQLHDASHDVVGEIRALREELGERFNDIDRRIDELEDRAAEPDSHPAVNSRASA